MSKRVAFSLVPQPEQLHEWVSFDDPDEQRTWLIDATFLRSNYKCIYGEGCKGVLDDDAEDLQQGCCSYGAHFLDEKDFATVKKTSKLLEERHWQNKKIADRKGWHVVAKDGSKKTRVVNGACIFHNQPGFEGGSGCALHIAAVEAGERHMDWKPDVCWQVPVRLEEHTEEDGHVVSMLREWKRRDWGDGGQEFHWWCTDSPEAFVGKDPAYVYFKDEITELVGKKVYALIVQQLSKTKATPVPHPAVRRRTKR